MSPPRRIPLSAMTASLPLAAATISGSTSSDATAVSRLRPPWFDTMIASAPLLTDRLVVLTHDTIAQVAQVVGG